MPPELPFDMLLVGAGAIGNGVIYLVGLLPASVGFCLGEKELAVDAVFSIGEHSYQPVDFRAMRETGSVVEGYYREDARIAGHPPQRREKTLETCRRTRSREPPGGRRWDDAGVV